MQLDMISIAILLSNMKLQIFVNLNIWLHVNWGQIVFFSVKTEMVFICTIKNQIGFYRPLKVR